VRDREFAAIPIVAAVLGIGAALLVAADAGAWAWVTLGVATLVLAVLVAVVFSRRHRHPEPADAPRVAAAAAADTSTHRVLVVADESCTSGEFVEAVRAHAGSRTLDVYVIAPSLGSRLARWTGDEGAYAEADRHLNDTIGALQRAGLPGRGRIGAHDPLQAADDALREFPADEVLFAVHGAGSENWLEQGVVELARERYDVPVAHVVVETTTG
jgi:GABA permease